MSLLMSVCCCGGDVDNCDCPEQICWNWYYVTYEERYKSCSEFCCGNGVVRNYAGLYFTNFCTPQTIDVVLALFKAGSVTNCAAETDFPCPEGDGSCGGFVSEYTSCSLILSAQQTVCTQTFLFPNYRFKDEFNVFPSGITNTATRINGNSQGYATAGSQYTFLQLITRGIGGGPYKQTGIPDPSCGSDYDYSQYGLTIIIPPCRGGVPASCCP